MSSNDDNSNDDNSTDDNVGGNSTDDSSADDPVGDSANASNADDATYPGDARSSDEVSTESMPTPASGIAQATRPKTRGRTRNRVERTAALGGPGVAGLVLGSLLLMSVLLWGGDDLRLSLLPFLMYLALAQAWNLMAGSARLVSLANHATVGLGAHLLAFLADDIGFNVLVSFALAGIATAAIMAVPGWFLVRLDGVRFALATLVIADLTGRIVRANHRIGGEGGRALDAWIELLESGREELEYFFALVVAIGATLVVYLIRRSRRGLALAAAVEDPDAAESFGVNSERVRFSTWVVGSLIGGLVGGLVLVDRGFFMPGEMFAFDEWTLPVALIVVVGGLGRIEGPIIGAAIYAALRGILGTDSPSLIIVMAVLALLVALFEPRGIAGYLAERHGIELVPLRWRLTRR